MTQRNFTSKDAALTINYISFVFRSLVNDGYRPDELLKHTGLTESALKDPDFRCTIEQHKTFVLNAIALTQNPHLGLEIGNRFNPINIGLPASAAMSSDNLSTALKVLQQFFSLNFSILAFDYHEQGDQLMLRCQPALRVPEIEYFVVSSSLIVTENLLRLLLGREQVGEQAEFSMTEVSGWQAYQHSLGTSVRFNAPFNQLGIPKHYLTHPLASSDPVTHQNMMRLCEQQKAQSYYGDGLEAQVCKVIVENHYHGLSIEKVASELGLSERSLRRQLSQSDTSYKQILDDLRESKARELLAIVGLPISTIAYDLGFSDPSNFSRTFKRWTQRSPQEFRETLSKPDT
ncbi:MAG: AraC family transcriptional regulator [Cellvibrionaceae bacterium]